MKCTEHVVRRRVFRSEVRPEVQTGFLCDVPVLEWADAHPVVWDIVTTRRSKAFGLGSCEYIGWAQRSAAPEAVLERVRHLHTLLRDPMSASRETNIFVWRAWHTLRFFKEKGFTGGFFQIWDGPTSRDCLTLDYTPATLEQVVDRFVQWTNWHGRAARVTVDGQAVRTLGEG